MSDVWHPLCFCYVTHNTHQKEQKCKENKRLRLGQTYTPKGYRKYVKEHKEKSKLPRSLRTGWRTILCIWVWRKGNQLHLIVNLIIITIESKDKNTIKNTLAIPEGTASSKERKTSVLTVCPHSRIAKLQYYIIPPKQWRSKRLDLTIFI